MTTPSSAAALLSAHPLHVREKMNPRLILLIIIFSIANGVSIATEKLKTEESYLSEANLGILYKEAVRDFAKYESRQKRSNTHRYRLNQKSQVISVLQDNDFSMDFLSVSKGQFSGVDFETALKENLLNHGDSTSAENLNIQDIQFASVRISEKKKRIQITLSWRETISKSWTFLYEVKNDGSLDYVKGIAYGCSSPESWIDNPSDPMNQLGDPIERTSR